jgi:cation transport ATPase
VTTGQLNLEAVAVARGTDQGEALRLVGALEEASEHPIAKALAWGARSRLGRPPAHLVLREPGGPGSVLDLIRRAVNHKAHASSPFSGATMGNRRCCY